MAEFLLFLPRKSWSSTAARRRSLAAPATTATATATVKTSTNTARAFIFHRALVSISLLLLFFFSLLALSGMVAFPVRDPLWNCRKSQIRHGAPPFWKHSLNTLFLGRYFTTVDLDEERFALRESSFDLRTQAENDRDPCSTVLSILCPLDFERFTTRAGVPAYD